MLLPSIFTNHWFNLIYLIWISFLWHRAIHRYLIKLLLFYLFFPFPLFIYLSIHCSFYITDLKHHYDGWQIWGNNRIQTYDTLNWYFEVPTCLRNIGNVIWKTLSIQREDFIVMQFVYAFIMKILPHVKKTFDMPSAFAAFIWRLFISTFFVCCLMAFKVLAPQFAF